MGETEALRASGGDIAEGYDARVSAADYGRRIRSNGERIQYQRNGRGAGSGARPGAAPLAPGRALLLKFSSAHYKFGPRMSEPGLAQEELPARKVIRISI